VNLFFRHISITEISGILLPTFYFYSGTMPQKRLSQKEFEAYLKKVLEQDYPKVKYQSPDSWRSRANRQL
jgi:hypothetical protein